MKKIFTPSGDPIATATELRPAPAPAPAASTVSFLRQFARAYIPGPRPSMPGIVLN